MSNLQVGLAIAGGLVLALVVAHNAWTARKNLPKQAEPEPGARPQNSADERREPVFDAALQSLAKLAMQTEQDRRGVLDALIDVIAPMSLDGALVSGDAALAALPPTRRAGSKAFFVEGLNQSREMWETPIPGQRYSAFQAGVQMANRTGALNEIEFSEFVMKAQAFADAVGASAEFPDMVEAVARARELDQFASAHDAQLGFTLHARSAAWSPGYIAQQAARLGLVAGALPGRLVLSSTVPGMPPVLTLSFDAQAAQAEDTALSAVRSFRMSLDVPQVPRQERPFVRLRAIASELAVSMEGVVTDDQGQPLSTEVMDGIGADLEQIYDQLEARDLAVGSELARRLFS